MITDSPSCLAPLPSSESSETSASLRAATLPSPLASLKILASGSSGNCSLLAFDAGSYTRVILIDAGISPARIKKLLRETGLGFPRIEGVLLTHLDQDHIHPGLLAALPSRTPLLMHRRFLRRAENMGLLRHRTLVLESDCEPIQGMRIRTTLAQHDDLGSTILRMEWAKDNRAASLGFATDLGQAEPHIIDHLRGVSLLAIESNYCPILQAASPRPEFLKRRITGGKGHLSNQQSAEAVRQIAPTLGVVLLHLSRHCNTPELVAREHTHENLPVTVSLHDTPTPWLPITSTHAPTLAPLATSTQPAQAPIAAKPYQLSLFAAPQPA